MVGLNWTQSNQKNLWESILRNHWRSLTVNSSVMVVKKNFAWRVGHSWPEIRRRLWCLAHLPGVGLWGGCSSPCTTATVLWPGSLTVWRLKDNFSSSKHLEGIKGGTWTGLYGSTMTNEVRHCLRVNKIYQVKVVQMYRWVNLDLLEENGYRLWFMLSEKKNPIWSKSFREAGKCNIRWIRTIICNLWVTLGHRYNILFEYSASFQYRVTGKEIAWEVFSVFFSHLRDW